MVTEYNISRPAGLCVKCGQPLQEEQEYVAVLTEQGEQFERSDWCLACWDAPDRATPDRLFSTWRARMPRKEPRKKLFVDDEALVNFFQRLAGEQEPARRNFRFVLALVLMRKRLLVYERAVKDEQGNQTWLMRLRGQEADQTHEVFNPRLDEETITQVSEQLTQILQGDL